MLTQGHRIKTWKIYIFYFSLYLMTETLKEQFDILGKTPKYHVFVSVNTEISLVQGVFSLA